MKNINKACLLLTTTMLLVGCNSNKKELERADAYAKVNQSYDAVAQIDSEYPSCFSLQTLSIFDDDEGNEEERINAVSVDKDSKFIYYSVGDLVVKGYDATEVEEDEESTFEDYTLNYSNDGGETFLEEDLVGEEALLVYEEMVLKAYTTLKAVFFAEKAYTIGAYTQLEALEATLPEYQEDEEVQENDLAMDLSELYYEDGSEVHFGFAYTYGPLVAVLNEEGEQEEDEDGNPAFEIGSESEAYAEDQFFIHLEEIDDVYYPMDFESKDLSASFYVDELIYEGEVIPEE